MASRQAMCSSAAWLWAWPLLLVLLCSQGGPAAGRPQAQERSERQERQQAQQRQQGTQGQQGQQDQQFFPLLALMGTRWFAQLSREQQQRQQQQQQQQTVTTTTTTTMTTSRANAAMQPAAVPAMVMPAATAPAAVPSVLTAPKPAVPAGEVLLLDVPAPAGLAELPARAAAVAPAPVPMPAPTMVGAAPPAPQQELQQHMQPPPVSVDVTAVIPPGQTGTTQPEATPEGEPIVDETLGYDEDDDWPADEAMQQPAAATLAATPAQVPIPAPGPLVGRSATGPVGNAVPVSSSAAKVQSPRVVSEVAASGRPVVIPVKPLSDVVMRNKGQQPRRRRRQPASPAAVPAILPLTEVLPKQQVQLQGQSVGA